MKLATIRSVIVGTVLLTFAVAMVAQQSGSPAQSNASQASQPAASSSGPATGGSGMAPAAQPAVNKAAPGGSVSDTGNTTGASGSTLPQTINYAGNGDDNPYDPLLEPPPLPKGKTTLIGGLAIHVDKVRNRVEIQPFGGGKKVTVVIDERSHLFRNGTPITILGIHKGDHVYVDTMLAKDNKIFARNVRVITETEMAEVRGQVISTNPAKGTVHVRDQLSARPVSFVVNNATQYSSTKGAASQADLEPGSLIDVQFSPRSDRPTAKEIAILAKPGDNYIFSGKVTNLDMRTGSFFVDNKSDDESYEVHFTPAAVSDMRALRVGSQVTTRATFDGKQYVANNVRVEAPETGEADAQSKAQ